METAQSQCGSRSESHDQRTGAEGLSSASMNAVSIVERCIPPSLKGNPASSRSKEVLGNRVSSKLKEQPLLEYVPSSYICVLEGKLLANGDLKGSWRTRHGDKTANKFFMVLIDRGIYDGGFNITTVNSDNPSTPPLQEIRDTWFELEWCSTTGRSSNMWGRGRNWRFGECHLLGSHEAFTRDMILYKVEEAELKQAQLYARNADSICATVSTGQPRQEQQKQLQQCQETSCRSCGNSAYHSCSASINGASTAKRSRLCSRAGEDIVPAYKEVIENGSSRTDGRPVNDKRRVYRPGHPAYNSIRVQHSKTVYGSGAVSSSVNGDREKDGIDRSEVNRVQSVVGSKGKEVGPPPNKGRKGQIPSSRGALPGFSGLFGDDDYEDPGRDTPKNVGSISNLANGVAKMNNERAEILENFRVLKHSLENAKADFEQRITNAIREELAMLDAYKAIRRKREDLEAGWKRANAGIEDVKLKTAELEENNHSRGVEMASSSRKSALSC